MRLSYKLLGNSYLPEVLLLLAAFLLCTSFPEYLPTTPDDYAALFTGWKDGWVDQNRLLSYFTEPVITFINKSLFSIRWTGGLHIATHLAPTLALYFILRRQSLISEARLGTCIILAIQVLGYEHTTPLAYPVSWSLANAISIWSGFELGRNLACKDRRIKLNIQAVIYIIAGCIAGLFYEYFPLLFFVASLWGFLAHRGRLRSYNLHFNTDQNLRAKTFLLASISAPVLFALGLKIVGWLLKGNDPSFNTYQGTSIDVTGLPIEFLIKSVKISLKTLLNATIVGNINTLLSWPEKAHLLRLNFTSFIFSALIAMAAWSALVQNNKRLNVILEQQAKRNRILAFAALLIMTAVQLGLNSLTVRHHTWFFDIFRTYLNASLAVTTAAFTIAVVVTIVLQKLSAGQGLFSIQFSRKTLKFSIIITIGYLALATMSHNLAIAEIIHIRAKSLEDITTTCLRKQSSTPVKAFESDPEPIKMPFIIHDVYLEKGNGAALNTICRDALQHPLLFNAWSNANISQAQMDNLVKYGDIQPDAEDLLRRTVLPSIFVERYGNDRHKRLFRP